MKYLITLFIVFLLAIQVQAFRPDDMAWSSGEQTADAAIYTKNGFFHQLVIMPDGTNAVTVSIYDNASAASGTEIMPTMTFAGDGGAQATPPVWIEVQNGIYIDITTAGTVAYVVLYRER